MFGQIFKIMCALLILAGTSGITLAQEGVDGTTVRPEMTDAKVQGCKVAAPGEYAVSVDDLIELEYSFPVVPAAIPKKIGFSQTLIGAIAPSPLGIRHVVSPHLVGSGRIAAYFEAKNAGPDTVTLDIDGAKYEYKFSVAERVAAEEGAKEELCEGQFFAIQTSGRVFLFAHGVHPTGGYKTRLRETMITVFPPEFQLVHQEPGGASTMVIMPFSVGEWFEAKDKVERVIVHDAKGRHEVSVLQMQFPK